MRLCSICSVVIVLTYTNLAPSIAAAQNATMKTHYCDHQRHWRHHFRHHRLHKASQVYSTCTCNFGYGDVCSVVVSCFTEGGRCSESESCLLEPQSEHPTSWKAPPQAATTELARKCEGLTAKAYPPRVPGNPAAGAKGTGKVGVDYFNKCMRNGARIDHQSHD